MTCRDEHEQSPVRAPSPRPLQSPATLKRQQKQYGSAHNVLVHNHPSGDPTPSRADIETTKLIMEAGKQLGIAVHDHIIVGKKSNAS